MRNTHKKPDFTTFEDNMMARAEKSAALNEAYVSGLDGFTEQVTPILGKANEGPLANLAHTMTDTLGAAMGQKNSPAPVLVATAGPSRPTAKATIEAPTIGHGSR